MHNEKYAIVHGKKNLFELTEVKRIQIIAIWLYF